MVAIFQCPTHQPAGADWYRCVMPSMSSDTLVTLKSLCGFHKSCEGHEKPAKSLVSQTPRGLGAAQFPACTRATVLCTPRTCRTGLPARQTTPALGFAVCGDGVFHRKTLQIATRLHYRKQSEGAQMYHRDVIAKIARRLPHRTQRDVAEVVEILTEVWSEELLNGEEIIVPEIGRLCIEVQNIKAGGALGKYGQLRRVYGRFRPSPNLKKQIQEVEFE